MVEIAMRQIQILNACLAGANGINAQFGSLVAVVLAYSMTVPFVNAA